MLRKQPSVPEEHLLQPTFNAAALLWSEYKWAPSRGLGGCACSRVDLVHYSYQRQCSHTSSIAINPSELHEPPLPKKVAPPPLLTTPAALLFPVPPSSGDGCRPAISSQTICIERVESNYGELRNTQNENVPKYYLPHAPVSNSPLFQLRAWSSPSPPAVQCNNCAQESCDREGQRRWPNLLSCAKSTEQKCNNTCPLLLCCASSHYTLHRPLFQANNNNVACGGEIIEWAMRWVEQRTAPQPPMRWPKKESFKQESGIKCLEQMEQLEHFLEQIYM